MHRNGIITLHTANLQAKDEEVEYSHRRERGTKRSAKEKRKLNYICTINLAAAVSLYYYSASCLFVVVCSLVSVGNSNKMQAHQAFLLHNFPFPPAE